MRTNRLLNLAFPALALILVGFTAAPAFARSGGSGSGSGGGTVTTTTTIVAFNNSGQAFHGVLPSGQVTFTYSKDGSYKNLRIELSNINVPDGDTVEIYLDEAVRVSNWISHTYSFPHITIYQGSGIATWSTANGDAVPFLLPTVGTTSMTVWGDYTDWPGTDELATGTWVESMMFGALTRG